ncbi:MAG TPA: methyltransferase domain-containing protein [Ktedonobacterales bacterium]
MLTCPVCGAMLAADDHATLRCPLGHAFDRAREGYVNLLAATPGVGDTAVMVRARRAFLERGYYAPLADALNEMALGALAGPGSRVGTPELGDAGGPDARAILDAGCGEGYYIGRLHDALAGELTERAHRCFGLDISRAAIRLAARRHREVMFVVADVWHGLPFASGSLHLLLDVFAPRNPGEFARVLALGGVLLVAIPGPAHLAELRDRLGLIGIEADKREHVVAQLAGPFALAETRGVEYALRLDGPDLQALATMTPSYWHLAAERREAIGALGPTKVTVSFMVLAFHRQR